MKQIEWGFVAWNIACFLWVGLSISMCFHLKSAEDIGQTIGYLVPVIGMWLYVHQNRRRD